MIMDIDAVRCLSTNYNNYIHWLRKTEWDSFGSSKYLGSSTETVAFQVYEILKINHEFLQFF